jgi:acyl-coenzyme A thioesterase PaaI-like protein
MTETSLQDTYAPHNECFGCGPSNPKGLQIKSIVKGDRVVADWQAESHHEAFPGMLNGGIQGALLDCHSNWTAAWHLMERNGEEKPPCTVTADFHVKLLRPTPSKGALHLEAWVVDSSDRRATIDAEISVDGEVCATCRGNFVTVKPGHPAYHRW